jgi:hypothetical protein
MQRSAIALFGSNAKNMAGVTALAAPVSRLRSKNSPSYPFGAGRGFILLLL